MVSASRYPRFLPTERNTGSKSWCKTTERLFPADGVVSLNRPNTRTFGLRTESVVAPAIGSAPKLSVIMPTFNRGAMMELTVGAFLACAAKVEGEIIIVDDGSSR